MTSVAPYTPSHDFASDPAARGFVDTAALQAEFQALSANISALLEAQSVIARDDDTLVDEIVRLRNLHQEIRTYLDSITTGSILTAGIEYRFPVRAATVANLGFMYGEQTVDGVALVSGDRILVKDQTDASQNGLWEVHAVGEPAPHASGLWVRCDDLPAAGPSGSGWGVCVEEGTQNGETAWMIVAGGTPTEQPLVGTDDLAFASIFGVFPLPVTRGGTGAATAATARANLGAAGKYSTTITGNAGTVVFGINHNLGTNAVVVSVMSVATGEHVDVDVYCGSSLTTCSITFTTAPGIGEQHLVTVIG